MTILRTNKFASLFFTFYGESIFFIKKFLGLIPLPKSSMSGSLLSEKISELARDKHVIEYGAGGSTVLFSMCAKSVFSVESDKKYISSLNKYFRAQGLVNVELHYANIGPTKSLGYPIKTLNSIYKRKYSQYGSSPYKASRELEGQVLVFIDGRFRVHSALISAAALNLPITMVFDDYCNRPEYHVIEKFFGAPFETLSNAAIFLIEKINFRSELESQIQISSEDPR